MIDREQYVTLLAALINRDPDPRTRETRVREANRELYRGVVRKGATTAQADLALAEAASKEQI